MRGLRAVLVVAGDDIRQPDADAEWLRLAAARWATAGVAVTWLARHADGLPSRETVDGIRVVRPRGPLAWWAGAFARRRGVADAVLVRHPASLALSRWAPAVHLVSGWSGGRRPWHGSVVVRSPAERRALRAELGLRCPVFVVPQGLPAMVRARSATPCVAVSGLPALREVAAAVPGVRVEDAGCAEVLDRAWLLVSAAGPPTWDAAVVEAARRGVPCIVRPGSALADIVVDGVTGWLADAGPGSRVAAALAELADPVRAARMAASCRALAGRLSVERGADLLAGILLARATATGRSRRQARPDLSTVAGFPWPADGLALRATDEVWVDGHRAVALLHGCDEVDAWIALARQGSTPTFVRLATGTDLLTGPAHSIG